MTMTPELLVGRIAAEYPLSTRVFARHQIDYCCGGGRPLAEVCRANGLDPEHVLAEIRQEIEPADGHVDRWDAAPLGNLIDHIWSVTTGRSMKSCRGWK